MSPRKRRDMRDLCLQGMCLLTILRAAKGRGIAPLRNQKREKAASLPKISINIFDISKEGVGGWGVEGLERNVQMTFLVGKINTRGFPKEKCTVNQAMKGQFIL